MPTSDPTVVLLEQNRWAAHPADELVTGSRGDRTFTFARGAVLSHVMTHGMHHRAQCLNMLRHVGVDPVPPSSVLEWIMMADAQAAAS